MQSEEHIYVLQIGENSQYYYIGKTGNLSRRFLEHKNGVGSEWTKLHGNIKLLNLYPVTGIFDEDMKTLEYMKLHGIDNVRGGSYVSKTLHKSQIDSINIQIRAATNACHKCGEVGHFVNDCTLNSDNVLPEVKPINLVEEFNKSKLKHDGKIAVNNSVEKCVEKDVKPARKKYTRKPKFQILCDRCGRTTHSADTCVAKTDTDGKYIRKK